MRLARTTIAALSLLLSSFAARAHPGHEAPPVHAHDLEEALVIATVILVVGLIAWAGRNAWLKRRSRVRKKP